jgi:hypothetical protein
MLGSSTGGCRDRAQGHASYGSAGTHPPGERGSQSWESVLTRLEEFKAAGFNAITWNTPGGMGSTGMARLKQGVHFLMRLDGSESKNRNSNQKVLSSSPPVAPWSSTASRAATSFIY